MRAATRRVQSFTFITAVGALLAGGCGSPPEDGDDIGASQPPSAVCATPARDQGLRGKPAPIRDRTGAEWGPGETADQCADEDSAPDRALERVGGQGLLEDAGHEPPCSQGVREGLTRTLWQCGADDWLWHRITEADWACPDTDGLTVREELVTPMRCSVAR